jgi:hypothetical protein
VSAIAVDRWQQAQAAEREYWYPANDRTREARRQEEHDRALWIAELLGITPDAVAGRSVLDIGGGPQPIVAWPELPLASRTLVDPMDIPVADWRAMGGVSWYRGTAESFTVADPCSDEVWGYNVLQHVLDPRTVLANAKECAIRVVRWFEWTNQPVSVVHPHVITEALFGEAFHGWRPVRCATGTRDEGRGWRQTYLAGVWERPA